MMAARPAVGARAVRVTVVTVLSADGVYVVDRASAGLVPAKVYWSHDSRGWAAGPDGAPLGLWADELVTVRRLLPGGGVGPAFRVRVADVTSVARPFAAERQCA